MHQDIEDSQAPLCASLQQQLRQDRAQGLLAECSDEDIQAAVVDVVSGLWPQARIKAFLPVIAYRQARKHLLSTAQRNQRAIEPG